MPLVPAKCPCCGAPLQVNPNSEQLICRYCGNEFVVEEAIKNYNINITDSQVNNNFNGATVYIQNGPRVKEKTRELHLRFGAPMTISGSWEFFVDGQSVCSMGKGEWTVKITEEEHTLQAKLYGDGTIQITNVIKIEPSDEPVRIAIRNRVFGSPVIAFDKK